MGYNITASVRLFEISTMVVKERDLVIKMKIMHIVGNRPQFIKLASISREIRKIGWQEVIVHTGQHYDENMSNIFFKELDIPQPKVNLNVRSGTHTQVIATIMVGLEKVVINEQPDGLIIYGDTNSTLAAAIVVSKLNIPLFHVEAGPRTYNKKNPEEQNRIVADHLSDYLFVPDQISADNLKKEGIPSKQIVFSGDVMYDQFLYSTTHSTESCINDYLDQFILMTWHRQENTCSKNRMTRMLSFIEKIKYKIVLPIHPRTKKCLIEYGLWQRVKSNENLIVINPVGYQEMTVLLDRCCLLISDSGGASKEASFAGKKCFFPLELAVWPKLIEDGYISIVNIEDDKSVQESIKAIEEIICTNKRLSKTDCFGNGNAAKYIVATIEKTIRL